jgi:hypothetical protein
MEGVRHCGLLAGQNCTGRDCNSVKYEGAQDTKQSNVVKPVMLNLILEIVVRRADQPVVWIVVCDAAIPEQSNM